MGRINDRLHLYLSFQWAESWGAPSPSTRGMKTSAESLLITISNARRARESERIKGEWGRKEERESGLSCAEARIAKLNEREICTVSARAARTARRSACVLKSHAWGDSASCMCRFTHKHAHKKDAAVYLVACACMRRHWICMFRSMWVCDSEHRESPCLCGIWRRNMSGCLCMCLLGQNVRVCARARTYSVACS